MTYILYLRSNGYNKRPYFKAACNPFRSRKAARFMAECIGETKPLIRRKPVKRK